jgi:alginate O-acetyltransferase complex protein AlgI
MVFSSPLFLFLFLPIVLAVYFSLPGLSSRNNWLLAVSLLFYAWGEIGFTLLLLASTLINYQLGKWVDGSEQTAKRKRAVVLAVIINIGFLCFFKYAGLVVSSLNLPIKTMGWSTIPVPNIDLPIGISFFTFHALSYILDIYRQKRPAARDLRETALYIFFFPQLVAGPILRWNAIAPQLEHREHRCAVFAEGVRRFVGGLAKKMIIANAVALPADQIFALPKSALSMSLAWFGIVCYTVQIYFDFSGYSDMAVGLGKMLGFSFMENFNFPYAAQSIRDFWRRWHISLSSWFRDYLYIPLGGNRVSEARNRVNLLTVFFLCGLWHGASWTFIAWGLYHGVFLVLERTSMGNMLGRLPRLFRHVYTLFAVMIGWVLFRAENFEGAKDYFVALTGFADAAAAQPLARYAGNEQIFALLAGTAFSVPLWSAIKNFGLVVGGWLPSSRARFYFGLGQAFETLMFLVLLLVSAAWLAGGTYNPFIYYRF